MSKKTPNQDLFIWEAEVRGHELDLQGIVNNARYLEYFDHVRIKQLLSNGIDWGAWHNEGYNLVLAHTDLSFKAPLHAHDTFYITSKIKRSGKLRIIFNQEIYRKQDEKLIATAVNTVVCVSIKTQRPLMPERLKILLFGNDT